MCLQQATLTRRKAPTVSEVQPYEGTYQEQGIDKESGTYQEHNTCQEFGTYQKKFKAPTRTLTFSQRIAHYGTTGNFSLPAASATGGQ